MSPRSNRGSTLIEVLIAGAILAIGMTAIAAMLTESSFSSRSALRKTEAAELGVSTLEKIAAQGYNQTYGTFDAGCVIDDAGIILYERTYTVLELNDAGLAGTFVGLQGYALQVDVSYYVPFLSNRIRKTQTFTTVISNPDAG